MSFVDICDPNKNQTMLYGNTNQTLMANNDLYMFYQSDPFRPRTRSMTNSTRNPVNYNSNDRNYEMDDVLSGKNSTIRKLTGRNNNEESSINQINSSINSFIPSSQPPVITQKPRVFLPRRKIKRVPVTSCDTCRLRKLRCNSKELGEGKKCSQCTKSGVPCTFEDRDEMLQVPKAKTNSTRKKKSTNLKNNTKVENFNSNSLSTSLVHTMIGGGTNYPTNAIPSHNDSLIPNSLYKMTSTGAPYFGITSQQNQFSLSHYSLQSQPQLDLSAFSLSSVPVTMVMPWQAWNLPLQLTDSQSGTSRSFLPQQLIDLLIHRFYQTNSFCSIILPDRGYSHSSLLQGSSNSIPNFLLQTILACAAWSDLSKEPELVAWRSSVWSSATQSVHDQLNNTLDIEIELIQALLLLCTNWPGDLIRVERINTLDAAVGLATTIGLQSRNVSGTTLESQSIRLTLFWLLYCFDKILCSATGRVPSLPSTCHDMPLPTSENLTSLGIQSQGTELAWLQRLSISFIKLCQLLEEVQSTLFEPIAMGWMSSLPEVLMSMQSLEAKLEQFCREHRWFLGNISSFSVPHKNLAEGVITQMHLTQLQLYLAPLKFEAAYSATRPITFSMLNQKALTATIESSWHLIQQANQVGKGSIDLKTERPMNLSFAALHFGANAFKFLATNWAQWQGGAGCVPYAPRNECGVDPSQIQTSLSNGGVSQQNIQFCEGQATETVPTGNIEVHSALNEGQNHNYNRTLELTRLEIKDERKNKGKGDVSSSDESEGQVLEMPPSTSRQKNEGVLTSGEPKSSASFLLCTPARLLFQDVEASQDQVNQIENVNFTNNDMNSNSVKSEKQIEECPKIHAMLAPLDPDLVNEMSKLESLLFPGGTLYSGGDGISESELTLHSGNQNKDQFVNEGGDSNYIHGPSSTSNHSNRPSSAIKPQSCRAYPDPYCLLDETPSKERRMKLQGNYTSSNNSNSTFVPRISQQ